MAIKDLQVYFFRVKGIALRNLFRCVKGLVSNITFLLQLLLLSALQPNSNQVLLIIQRENSAFGEAEKFVLLSNLNSLHQVFRIISGHL